MPPRRTGFAGGAARIPSTPAAWLFLAVSVSELLPEWLDLQQGHLRGDIQSAVRLVFPGELSRHAVSEGCKERRGQNRCWGLFASSVGVVERR